MTTTPGVPPSQTPSPAPPATQLLPPPAPAPRTWMPPTAGILSIIGGAVGIIMGFTMGALIGGMMSGMMGPYGGMYPGMGWLGGGFGIPSIIFGVVAIIGGIYALKRRVWGMALAGAICALFSWAGILGVLSIIFVSISKKEFA